MTTPTRPILRSQRLRLINHQGDALRLGMNWTEEDLGKPQVLVDSVYGMGHPGTFHFRELIEEVSNGVYKAGGKPPLSPVNAVQIVNSRRAAGPR
jgi:dihydroxy-acid dehydratase